MDVGEEWWVEMHFVFGRGYTQAKVETKELGRKRKMEKAVAAKAKGTRYEGRGSGAGTS